MPRSVFPTPRELRLAAYLHAIDRLDQNSKTFSSQALADITGVQAQQVRRDLSEIGRRVKETLGLPGLGYDVQRTRAALVKIMGGQFPKKVSVLGTNKVGEAVREAVQTSSFFSLVEVEEEPDFIFLVGQGPFPEMPSGAVRLTWPPPTQPGDKGPLYEVQSGPIHLLLAFSWRMTTGTA